VAYFLLILLLVAAALAAALHRLHGRVTRLERELERRREGHGASPPRPAAAAPGEPSDRTLATLFERVVGGRLLVWIGGIALAAGGIFLIRHSIELVTPGARMTAAALLGLVLIAAGEYARAGRQLANDPRVGQALVGAGIAVLYATAYGSHILFGLIGAGTAAGLMVLITGAALALSLRHGAPTAALGLVGGFLTPLLVGDKDAGALPVLAYLGLLDLAIFAIGWRRDWPWLLAAAIAASFMWTGAFILGTPEDALAGGTFAALLGLAATVAAARRGRVWLALAPAAALAELALLVARTDVAAPAWLLFGAVTAAALALAARRPEHRFLPPTALLLALTLIAVKAGFQDDPLLPWAAAAATILFGTAALPKSGTGRRSVALTACGGLAGPLLILRLLRPDLLGATRYGLLALLLALAALALLALLRRRPAGGVGSYGAGATAALLLAFAAHDLAPVSLVSAAWLLLAALLLVIGMKTADKSLRVAGLALLTATIFKVFLIDASELEGVLRILSFLGLGVALIGIGKLYGKVLAPVRPQA
jgi:uncharacterized membrane protein